MSNARLRKLLADFDPDAYRCDVEAWDRAPPVGREVNSSLAPNAATRAAIEEIAGGGGRVHHGSSADALRAMLDEDNDPQNSNQSGQC
jgi:hypothetical protein